MTPASQRKNLKAADASSAGVAQAVRSANFWLILAGSTLVIGAIER